MVCTDRLKLPIGRQGPSAPGRSMLKGGLDLVEQYFQMQGFFQKIVSTGLYGGHCRFDAGMSAHHDDGERRKSAMQTFQELHTVHAREPDIQQAREGSMVSSLSQKLSASGKTMV